MDIKALIDVTAAAINNQNAIISQFCKIVRRHGRNWMLQAAFDGIIAYWIYSLDKEIKGVKGE